jgi:hypothetical protein
MKWQSAIQSALTELKAVEAGIARELAEVRQKIVSLAHLTGGSVAGSTAPKKAGAKRHMSAAGRAAIAKAAKKRWAKHRAEKRAAEAKQG